MADTQELKGMRIAIIASDMFEEAELRDPRQALLDAGAETDIISEKPGYITAANHFDKGKEYEVNATFDEVDASDYDALLLPGGALNADFIRVNPDAQKFVQEMDEAGKVIASICHAAWLLVSARLVEGRKLTSYHTIADDIRNAGGKWSDQAVVIDNNWVSSRQPSDIPEFNQALIMLLIESKVLMPAM